MEYNIYCDESCHLEHDGQAAMVLGAVWCPAARARGVFKRIREIKSRHYPGKLHELKWTKVSRSTVGLYRDVLDYFFDDDDLHFRCVVVPDKASLNHADFDQDHDTWYYKMFFNLLKVILEPEDRYRIYLDYKDTNSSTKCKNLRDVLSDNAYDFERRIVRVIQPVKSHEVELIQLADMLCGIVAYENRGLSASEAKSSLVSRMKERSGYSLRATTLLREWKVNVLRWRPNGD